MYVGVPLILFAWFALKSKFKEKKFFVLGALISLIIATNLPFVKYLYLLPIPVISTTVPTRELSVFIFFVIVLAAFGINFWEKINKKTKIPYLFLFVYLLIWIASILLNKYGVLNFVDFKVAVRNLILPTSLAILTFLVFRSNKNLSKIFLTLLLVIDLLYFFNKITPFSDQQLIYPKTSVVSFIKSDAGINRFWGYGSGYISPNFQSVDGTFSPEGNDPLHLSSYGKLLASSSDGKLPEVLPRPDANIAPGFGTKDLKDNFFRKRILDLLGVKYIIHKNENDNEDLETFPRDSYKLIWSDKPLQVYENKNSLPRFFLANDYKIYSNKDEVLKGIYDKNIDLGKTMLLENTPNLQIDRNATGAANLLSYASSKVSILTNSSGNEILFLSDNYYPEWDVLIDGKISPLLVADYSFRAVAIPKGKHKVEFVYNPKLFILGLKFSVLGILGFFAVLFLIRKYGKKI